MTDDAAPLYSISTSKGVEAYVFHCMPDCDVFHVALHMPELEASQHVAVEGSLENAIIRCNQVIQEYEQ